MTDEENTNLKETTDAQETEPSVNIIIPAQGVNQNNLTIEAALNWFDKEIKFWHRVGKAVPESFNLAGLQYDIRQIADHCRSIVELARSDIKKKAVKARDFTNFIMLAGSIGIVVGQSRLGEKLESFVAGGQADEAAYLLIAFTNNADQIISARGSSASPEVPIRLVNALREFHTALSVGRDVSEVTAARQLAEKNLYSTAALRLEIGKWFQDEKGEIDRLKRTYEELLQLSEPAKYWQDKAQRHGNTANLWLSAFVLVLIGVAFIVFFNFAEIQSVLLGIAAKKELGSIFGSFAVISIPVLALAWVLKHISRLFIHNLTLGADAENRRAIISTYLALTKEEGNVVNKEDRAIILNAIARAAPDQGSDDGPPIGIVDLLKSRTGSN